MGKGSKKKSNLKVKSRKASNKKQTKDPPPNKSVATDKSDKNVKYTSPSANHASADEQMSQDPNTYDRPPDISNHINNEITQGEKVSTQKDHLPINGGKSVCSTDIV